MTSGIKETPCTHDENKLIIILIILEYKNSKMVDSIPRNLDSSKENVGPCDFELSSPDCI